jgi:cell division septation protein DedD
MRGVFDDREFQQAETRPETELTLGSTTLLLIFFGLVLLCGLCFGLGYVTGHSGTQETAAALAPAGGAASATRGESGLRKPSADAQPGGVAPQPSAAINQQEPADDSSVADGSAQSPAAPAAPATSAALVADGSSKGLPQVKPAFGSPAIPAQAGLPAAAAVGPALVPAGSLMVQIAAVSRQEDANVLMSALRKHGYAVAAQREPLDGLIHVRIGPFTTRDEAEKWRIKLLNDGYNAIVQP